MKKGVIPLDLARYLIPLDTAEEGFKEWIQQQGYNNMRNHFKRDSAFRHMMSDNSKDFMKRITVQKAIHALYKALKEKGESFNDDPRTNKNYKGAARDTWQVAKNGNSFITHTINNTTFVIIGNQQKTTVMGMQINEVRYLSSSGEKIIRGTEVRSLIAPYFE